MARRQPTIDSSHIPWDKSWIIRMGLLDLIHGRTQIAEFLQIEHANLSDDLLALERTLESWDNDQPIDVGESGTLYRLLQFTAWKQGTHRQFIKHGTLRDRPIASDPSIVHKSQETLLSLDNQTSQWASAAALNGDTERVAHPPYKLALTYLAIDHWRAQINRGHNWIPRRDETIRAQADAFVQAREGKPLTFSPQQAEDYCFARAFKLMAPDEGKRRWPALVGHESNRIKEMETQLQQANSGKPITSRDHRVVQAIAMFGAIANDPLDFMCPECVRKSWPQFWRFLEEYSAS